MAFWLGILVGGLFAWFAIKLGFYETWAMLFNIIISIYLAVFLRPVIAEVVPAAGDTSYSSALIMSATAITSFLILHGISYTFLTGQFSVSFPKIFNTLGTGFLGFLAGFLVWSFASLLISTTPISQDTFVKGIGFDTQFEQTNMPYISWWCNLVNTVVSSQDSEHTAKEAISELLKKEETAVQDKPAEPNDVETGTTEKNHRGP
jgi:hypothetical protein